MLELGEYGDGPDALSLAQTVARAAEPHQPAGVAREGHAPTRKDAAAVERAERLAIPTSIADRVRDRDRLFGPRLG